jgi:hypothetical protein
VFGGGEAAREAFAGPTADFLADGRAIRERYPCVAERVIARERGSGRSQPSVLGAECADDGDVTGEDARER